MTAAPSPTPPLEFPSWLRAVRHFTQLLGSRRAAEERVIEMIEERKIRIRKMPTGGAKG